MSPNIRWPGLILVACVGLAGCAANDPTVPSDADVCQSTYGLFYGTPAFADCMASRQARRAHLAAALMSNPNFPVPLPAGPPPVLPPPIYRGPPPLIQGHVSTTTCSSSGGVTACVDR